jgi:hypothetical protein
MGRGEDMAGLGQQVGAALGGLCGGPLELPLIGPSAAAPPRRGSSL